jgi:FdhD protein
MPDDRATARHAARSAADPLRQVSARIERWHGDESASAEDELVAEEPLEIRMPAEGEASDDPLQAQFETLAVVLRTPGHDDELVAGFLYSEGFLASRDELQVIRSGFDADGMPSDNVRDVLPAAGVDLAARVHAAGYSRRFAVNASCGVCGKNTVSAACAVFPRIEDPLVVSPAVLYRLPEQLSAGQRVFHATGGLHAAGLFHPDGTLLALREDIGRHNAVDKLIGRALLDGTLPLANRILLVSGRLSFEIVLKALAGRIPLIAAVSAPSSLAAELADAGGITLAAFLRDTSMNMYTHVERVRA